jgi:hypothetical protein
MQKTALSPLATRLLTGGAIGTASGAALGGALAPEDEALNYALMGGAGGLGAGLLAGGGYHLLNRPTSLGGPVRSAPTPGKTPAPPAEAKPPPPLPPELKPLSDKIEALAAAKKAPQKAPAAPKAPPKNIPVELTPELKAISERIERDRRAMAEAAAEAKKSQKGWAEVQKHLDEIAARQAERAAVRAKQYQEAKALAARLRAPARANRLATLPSPQRPSGKEAIAKLAHIYALRAYGLYF